MTDHPDLTDTELHEDPELAAALTAAFGADGIQSFTEIDKEKKGSRASLSDLVSRLDAAMNQLGAVQQANLPESPDTVANETRCVVIECAGQLAAFPLASITEIERLPNYTILPRTPAWCLGVANMRGQIVSITDLAALANATQEKDQSDPKVVIVHGRRADAHTAVVIDRVIGIRSFQNKLIQSPEELSAPLAAFADQIANANGEQILILNADRILEHPEMQPFMNS
ncbi:MAG: chemotaxis protein CheW [Planctomycetota bacterium]